MVRPQATPQRRGERSRWVLMRRPHGDDNRRSISTMILGVAAMAVAVGVPGSVRAAEGSSTHIDPGANPAGADAACPPLSDDADDLDDADGAMAVMIDGSMSIATQTDRATAIVDLVERSTAERQVAVTIGSFGGTDAEVHFSRCLDGQLFIPDGNNARTRERNRPELIEGLTTLVDGLPADYESSDPTSALRAGVTRLTSSTVDGPRVLVIHTDGMATAGCAALPETVELGAAADELLTSLVANCEDDGQLPDATGVDVVIGGIGRTDADLDDAAVTFLLELNLALCESTGATCSVDPNLPTDVWPAADSDDD